MTLVEAYENKHYHFGPAYPVRRSSSVWSKAGHACDRASIGPSETVSQVLNRKRPLSLRMVKRLHDGLKIPYESLLTEVS